MKSAQKETSKPLSKFETSPRVGQKNHTKVVSINMQTVAATIEKAKHNVTTSANSPLENTTKTPEEKTTFTFSDVVSQSLPAPLADFRHFDSMQTVFNTLLNLPEDKNEIDNLRQEVLKTDSKLFCKRTKLIMSDPVIIVPNGEIAEREAIIKENITGIPLKLIDATVIAKQIKSQLHNRHYLEKIQYLPIAWMEEMADACKRGNVATIRQLYKKNYRLLMMPKHDTQCIPLQYAIQNEQSLMTVLELLDNRRKGLALASLLHPDRLGYLPLDNALHYNSSLNIILKLMACMGDALNSYTLKGTLPEKRKSMLNQLLLVCILRGNTAWAKKVLSWGGDMQAVMDQDKTVLAIAVAQRVNPDVIAELVDFSKSSEASSTSALLEKSVEKPSSLSSKASTILPLRIITDDTDSPVVKSSSKVQKTLTGTTSQVMNQLSENKNSYPTLPPSRSQLLKNNVSKKSLPSVGELSKPQFLPLGPCMLQSRGKPTAAEQVATVKFANTYKRR